MVPGQARARPAYNLPQALRVTGPLDVAALTAAVSGVAARHEALRTRLVTGQDGEPVQVIDPPAPVPLPLDDLSGVRPRQRQARLAAVLDSESGRPFSLEHGPLLRARLIRLETEEHVLLVVVHHVVFDGWSAGILVRDLAALYEIALHEAGASGLPPLAIQYGDYAAWERGRLQGASLAELESYWRGALAGADTVRFPADRARPAVDDTAGGLAERLIDVDVLDGLRDLARREGATLFGTLMAALLALLHRYTGQTDLVVGTVAANRRRPSSPR